MTYYAKPQRSIILLCFAFALITGGIRIPRYKEETFFFLAVILLFFIFYFLKFSFTINENQLTYQIFIFSFIIYQRVLSPSEIIQIKFIRIGWVKKGAIIKTIKGPSIRIIRFAPPDVCANLNAFANKNAIKVQKTKDYQILET